MKAVALIITSTLVLAGCASTGVLPMDKGTYHISQRSAQIGIGPPLGVKADVYAEANAFCAKQGQAVQTVDLQMVDSMPARPGSVSLQFRCVKDGPKESEQCIKNLPDDPALLGIKQKVSLVGVDNQTFDMLSDSTKPTPQEKDQLKIWGNKRAECMKLQRAEAQEDRRPLPLVNVGNASFNATQMLIVDLVNGNLTYGAFANKRQEIGLFHDDTVSKIQTELRKETQESKHKADQIAIEAQRNDIMRQKIYSDSVNTRNAIQSNERINQQRNYKSTTTNCHTSGSSTNCTTY